MLYVMVQHSLLKHLPPSSLMGLIWEYWDFFVHRRPLMHATTNKRPVKTKAKYISFEQPAKSDIDEMRSALVSIPENSRDDIGRLLLGFIDALQRILADKLGVGNHHAYFKPLWDPTATQWKEDNDVKHQFVGFEFFDICKHIEHLPDILTIEFHILFSLSTEDHGWFLDFTNPDGESLVAGGDRIISYSLFVNGARVNLPELPCFYHAVRRREYQKYLT